MQHTPPILIYEDLIATRNYIQEVALVLSSIQRAFVPMHPRDWHYGLEVGLRGLLTQPFDVGGESIRASLDLVRSKVRVGSSSWSLNDYTASEIYNNVKVWLESRGAHILLERPIFKAQARHFDRKQAEQYAAGLWWLEECFREVKSQLAEGITSPILLYPHHFDLSLVWFPYDDERQIAIGFSSGDATIAEPYLYLTSYPEPAGFTNLALPPEVHWQTSGFNGAILPYNELAHATNPIQVFQRYADLMSRARSLFD